ncbi:MAG: cupin domain-containing protein [Christensenellales bacterium]
MTKGQSATNRVKDSVFHLDKNDMTRPLQYGDVLVYQVGRMFCSRDNGIDEHVHPRLYELTCVTGGRGKVSANDEVTPVSAGDVFFRCRTNGTASNPTPTIRCDSIFCVLPARRRRNRIFGNCRVVKKSRR